MKYKIIYEDEDTQSIFSYFENTDEYFQFDFSAKNSIDDNLKDLYILSKHNKKPIEQKVHGKILRVEIPKDLILWEKPPSIATKFEPDFYNLNGKVYDQFADLMNTTIEFLIEGDAAEIVDGKVIEKEVTEDTEYKVVAKAGNLIQKQNRTVYAPNEISNVPEDVMRDEFDELKNAVEIMAGGAE